MKAVLLCAGLGTRLTPLTLETPKVLLPLADQPVIAHQLRYLSEQGFTSIAINTHKHDREIRDYINAGDWYSGLDTDMRIRIFHEPELLGTAGTLLRMRSFIRPNRKFFVLYGDVLLQESVQPMLQEPIDALARVVCYWDALPKGYALIEDGEVVDFTEKPQVAVAAGAYWCKTELLDLIESGDDFASDLIPRMLDQGLRVRSYALEHTAIDVGTWDGLEEGRAWATQSVI